jgi:hypothetical protein
MTNTHIHQDILKFRSYLDFHRESWLFSEQHHYTGIYKTSENIGYDIKWSPNYNYVFDDELGKVHIKPTSWTLPFHLEIERNALPQTESHDALTLGLHNFITHLIDCIEHIYLEVNVIKFKLDGRPVLFEDASSPGWHRLQYTEQRVDMNEIFEEYSLMGESGRFDVVCGEAASKEPMEISWQFLVDSIASFESGHYHGCVIYACSAVEVEVVPVVKEWLSNNTLTRPSELLREALIDLSNPIKFEIFFRRGKVQALDNLKSRQRASLLEELKWLNTTRNKVIHSGYIVQAWEAKRAIRASGLLLRVLWVHKQEQASKAYGMSGIFPSFKSKIRKLSL